MFLLAEAAAKGWISGEANTYYQAGVNASFGFYGLTLPSGYMDKVQIKLTGNADDNLKKIGFQKWISFFYQGMEA